MTSTQVSFSRLLDLQIHTCTCMRAYMENFFSQFIELFQITSFVCVIIRQKHESGEFLYSVVKSCCIWGYQPRVIWVMTQVLSHLLSHFWLSKYFVQHKLMQSTVYFEIVCVGESLSDNTQEAVFSCSIGNTDININKR